jgi:transcriptional regulator with XRE-family HTH domain
MLDLNTEEIEHIKKNLPLAVGKRIRQIREQKKITQIELAYRIFSDRQYLHKIEKGQVSLGVTKLAVILKALNVSFTDFFRKVEKF